MSDDDEFGLDNEIFDEADLAKIEEMERKYIASQQVKASQPIQFSSSRPFNSIPTNVQPQARDRFIRPLPPAKRLRTNEWSVTSVPNREYVVPGEEDDTPSYAVVAANDGKYRIVNENDPPPRTTSLAIPSASGSPMITHSPRTTSSQIQGPMTSQRQEMSSSSPFPRPPHGVGTQYTTAVASSTSKNVASSQSRFAAITAALKETRLSGPEDETEILRMQVAELRRANEQAAAALRTAHEEKLTKEGEISTIRRKMASLQDSHAETIAKIQAEKLANEEKWKQYDRQKKQEIERLQTNFALRRQEIETSTRKTPWSTRKRVGPGTRPTPAVPHFRPLAIFNETPSRPARLHIPDVNANGNANTASKKDKGKGKAPTFPTFVDSFQNTSPVKTPSKSQTQRNGNGARSAGNGGGLDMETMFPPILNLEGANVDNAPTPAPRSASSRMRAINFSRKPASVATVRTADEEESGPDWAESLEPGSLVLETEGSELRLGEEAEVREAMLEEDGVDEEEEPFEILDLKEQLYKIIFFHVSLPLYQLTLQMLLSTQIPEHRLDLTTEYVKASSALVEALAPKALEYGAILRTVITALLRMARILCDTSSMTALAGVFNLLASMCLFLPQTTSLLLPEEADQTIPSVLFLVTEVIKAHATPKEPFSPECELLIKECLNLLEILCLTIPKDISSQMRFIVSEPTFVSHLLDGRQPLWVLQSTIHILSILFTYEDASAVLLVPQRDFSDNKIPLLERISYLLLEPMVAVSQNEAHSLQRPILTILTQLALSSPGALNMLVQSQAVIPALVANLHNYSARVWEEDENLYDEPALLLISDIIQGTLRLLHYVVFKDGPQIDLQQKIQYPPPKMSSLEHMFVVGLGRLSFAYPPEWKSKVAREAIESSSGLARDLLESIVDGSDMEAIWVSFHDSEDNPGSEIDDEEMEARNAAPDDDPILVD